GGGGGGEGGGAGGGGWAGGRGLVEPGGRPAASAAWRVGGGRWHPPCSIADGGGTGMRRVTLSLVMGLALTVGACASAPTPTAGPDTSRTPAAKAALPPGVPDGVTRAGSDLAPPPAVALETPKKGAEDYRLAPNAP